ncbi:hypothetical protein Sme01_62340 [Sphaerisporangium melleum]|nr:ATP-binding protein [Sphaerisporangium melleum]GII73758.1 hypothetical protein Sme01_62340 [Sphaerisporangium melleum]
MVALRVYEDGEVVRVEVTDEGSDVPLPPIPDRVDPLSESGCGLWLVRELSSAWGTTREATGRTVWFQIALG